jgi:hypothetical protein
VKTGKLACLTLFIGLLCSCSVLSVHHKRDSVHGVPFFVRTSACRHELIWLEPIYTLTLQSVSTQGEKEIVRTLGTAEFSLSDYSASQAAIGSLKQVIVMGQDPISMWTVIQSNHAYNPLAMPDPCPNNIVLVSNISKIETIVDYRDIYYFNSHRPIIGTAKADIKLAPDGTMTEGSGELESKTLQSFLDLLPIKDLISKAGGLAAVAGAPGAIALTYRLQIESRAIKHTHYRYTLPGANATETQCPTLPAVAFGDSNYNRERDDLSTEKPAKKDDKNTIKLNGEIKLPEKDTSK